jgi:hypothetical protein
MAYTHLVYAGNLAALDAEGAACEANRRRSFLNDERDRDGGESEEFSNDHVQRS